MVLPHHKLPLLIIVALAVTFLMPSGITAQGIDNYYGSHHQSLRSEWEQRMWYADIYNFLYGNCEFHNYPSYYGEANNPAANNAPAYSVNTADENATKLLDEANVFYLTGSYQQAAETYAKAVNINPALSEGWLNLGNSLYFLGRYQASLDAYIALLNREPNNANALAGKNNALAALNKSSAISAVTT